MSDYRRPRIESRVFTDDAGAVIPYGRRWPDQPPRDRYSVSSNTERFAPLHTVADALVEHLATRYDAAVHEEAGLDGTRSMRVVRFAPASAEATPLTITYTDLPGIVLDVGVLHRDPLPACSCDACDEDWPTLVDELEQRVLAVADGRFAESIVAGTASYRWGAPDGSAVSSGSYALSGRAAAASIQQQRLALPWAREGRPWRIASRPTG